MPDSNSMRDMPEQVRDGEESLGVSGILADLARVRDGALDPRVPVPDREFHVETLFLAASAAVERLAGVSG
jgi:hypothetical protein